MIGKTSIRSWTRWLLASLKVGVDYFSWQKLTLDPQADEESKMETVRDLFKTGPSLSPRKAKVDKTDDKLQILQDEVNFLRQHSKSVQAELEETIAMLNSGYFYFTQQNQPRKSRGLL